MNESLRTLAMAIILVPVHVFFISCSQSTSIANNTPSETPSAGAAPATSAAMPSGSSTPTANETMKFVGGESEEVLKAELTIKDGTFTLKQWKTDAIPLDESQSVPKVGGTSGGGKPMGAGPSGVGPGALKRAREINEARKSQPPNQIITGKATIENKTLVLVIQKINGMEPYSRFDKIPIELQMFDDGALKTPDGRIFRRASN